MAKKILLAFFIFSLFLSLTPRKIDIMVSDIGRHLKNGEIFYSTGKIIDTNYYSYTEPQLDVINHHWLSGVLFYLVYLNFGFAGLGVFFCLLMSLSLYLLFLLIEKKSGVIVSISCLVFFMIFILSRLEVRPEVFSFLFVSLYLYLYESDFIKKQSLMVSLVLLLCAQILWVNLHIFFLLGPLISGLYFLRSLFSKSTPLIIKNFWLFLCVFFVNLINPWGVLGLLEPISIFYGYTLPVIENGPLKNILFLHPQDRSAQDYLLYFYLTLGLALLSPLLFPNFYKRKENYLYLGMFTLFGLLTLRVMRFISFYGLFGSFFFSLILSSNEKFLSVFRRVFVFVVPIALITLLFYALQNPMYGLGLVPDSAQAAQFIKENNLTGPVLNNYDTGSYIIFYLFPEEKVFVDGRPEAYSPEFQLHYANGVFNDPLIFSQMDRKYNFNLIFLPTRYGKDNEENFIREKLASGDWVRVFYDNNAVLLLREPR